MLSILIPTVTGRGAQFDSLTEHIYKQSVDGLQVKYMIDSKEMSIGMKRQYLLDSCDTEYFVMIDDDDTIPDNYVTVIMQHLQSKPDAITYLEQVNIKGGKQIACHSNKYVRWENNKDGYNYVRTPFYKDVIRTEIAKQIGFKDIRYGEDSDFASRLKASGLIKTEIHLKEIMYIYNAPDALSINGHKDRYGIK